MFLTLFVALLFAQTPDAPKPKPQPAPPAYGGSTRQESGPLELQGDTLGESADAFTARHPKAQCDTSAKPRVTCYQWEGVSIFGMSANASATCNLKKKYAADCLQGLIAKFTSEGLVSLVYTVGGIDKTAATEELKKKFGKPFIESREGTSWNIGDYTASIVITKPTDGLGDTTLITITISGS